MDVQIGMEVRLPPSNVIRPPEFEQDPFGLLRADDEAYVKA